MSQEKTGTVKNNKHTHSGGNSQKEEERVNGKLQVILLKLIFSPTLKYIFLWACVLAGSNHFFVATFMDISDYASMAKWQIGTSGKNWLNPFLGGFGLNHSIGNLTWTLFSPEGLPSLMGYSSQNVRHKICVVQTISFGLRPNH